MRTKNRVTAIVIKDNKILLVHRRKMGQEYWVVVGGGAEEGETLEQALEREVLEETGLKLLEHKYLGESIGEYEEAMHFYLCDLEDGIPTLGGPEKETNNEDNWYNLEWVSVEEIEPLALYPASTKKFIKAKPDDIIGQSGEVA